MRLDFQASKENRRRERMRGLSRVKAVRLKVGDLENSVIRAKRLRGRRVEREVS